VNHCKFLLASLGLAKAGEGENLGGFLRPKHLAEWWGVHFKLAHIFLPCLNDHAKKVNLNLIKQDNKL